MNRPVIFQAVLVETSCIKIDGNGGGRVTFTVDDTGKDALKHLIDLRQQNLIVTVELGD